MTTALPPFSLATGLSLLATVLLPLLVGLVTKLHTHPALKSALLLALATVTTSVTELAQRLADPGYHFSRSTWGYQLIVTIVVAQLAHAQVWKPLGVTEAVQSVGDPAIKAAAAYEPQHAAGEVSVSTTKPDDAPAAPKNPVDFTPAQLAALRGLIGNPNVQAHDLAKALTTEGQAAAQRAA